VYVCLGKYQNKEQLWIRSQILRVRECGCGCRSLSEGLARLIGHDVINLSSTRWLRRWMRIWIRLLVFPLTVTSTRSTFHWSRHHPSHHPPPTTNPPPTTSCPC